MDLTDATALVTGANRGIGLALARRLAREPLGRLLVGVRSLERYEPVAAPPGGAREITPVQMDLSGYEEIERSCAALGEDLERIDLLVNNAGLMTGGLLEEQELKQVYAMFQVNLVAAAHLTARVLPGMLARRRGKVVTNASISGYAWFPAATTYAASKAGVVALSESLRRELKGTGVTTLHLVTPGVNTGMLDDTEQVYGPYNAQVRCLREHLPDDVKVGTVDKFQGQDGAVAFFSMATSSGAELPRNLEFLFSRNRLNVAISRARCLAVLVCSPELLHVRCRSAEQMRLVNALCLLVEMAGEQGGHS